MLKLATLTLATTLACGAAPSTTLNQAKVCTHLLHYYPTPSPLAVKVGGERIMTCQPGLERDTLVLTFGAMSDLAWWQDHTQDRVILPDADAGDDTSNDDQ